ncbi:MAG: InlB B-repeat-containing protein [Gaiellaceae bacterium]
MTGAALAGLVLVTLAAGSGARAAAIVELQVAPRGPGSVSAAPAGVDLDNGNIAVTAPCNESDGADSCRWGYERGTTVTLSARAESGRSFVGWSDPDCPGTGSCSVTLDADTTSLVAVFSPLKLAVRYSGDGDGGTVTIDRSANTCTEGGADACFELAPRSEVRLTARPAAGHTFKGWNPGCEPTNAPTCTIRVDDQPTWVGAIFDNDEPPQLPTTIKVQFRLRKTGNGGGQVTASKLDCGGQCTAQYDYGQVITLTARPDSGALFDGWNGVCARTETTCRFPVGPITSIKAQFSRDAAPPTAPGTLALRSATRTGIVVGWTASTDSTGVAGYRIYLDGTAAGETTATEYSFASLACGRSYSIEVDAVDPGGNRSPRATLTAATRPCALAARLAGVGVVYGGGSRTVVVKVRVNRTTSARVGLVRSARTVVSARQQVRPGTNTVRLRVPAGAAAGAYRVTVALVNPDGGTLTLPSRNVLVRRGR